MGVHTTVRTNPEGVTFGSRGRQPTDTGNPSSSNPEGVTLKLSICIDYRHAAAGRLIRDGDRTLAVSPLRGFALFLSYLTVGLHPRAIECHPFWVCRRSDFGTCVDINAVLGR